MEKSSLQITAFLMLSAKFSSNHKFVLQFLNDAAINWLDPMLTYSVLHVLLAMNTSLFQKKVFGLVILALNTNSHDVLEFPNLQFFTIPNTVWSSSLCPQLE